MKASEAARIRGLLDDRRPPVKFEETTIEGVRMLVILDGEVDTVIRFSRGGSADMPQISTYDDVAESAAYADQKLAKQRASGRRNTTGKGADWPRDWKLDKAKAAGKIWYAEPRPTHAKGKASTSNVRLSHSAPTAEGLTKAHEQYRHTVPNNYVVTIQCLAEAISTQDIPRLARAVSGWLKNINQEYYNRWHQDEAATLEDRLEPILREELGALLKFRARRIATLADGDRSEVLRLFGRFRLECGPVGAAKVLHPLAPHFFPLWDTKIADGYGIPKETGYFQFMDIVKQQVRDLPEDLVPDVTVLKALDEYNYLQMSANAAVCA